MVRVKRPITIPRIDALDLLRGYFLLVILLNHLHYYPSGLEYITGKSFLYASTAEGFFLISGIVLGIVRGAKLIDKPLKEGARLLWKRAGQLYITSIVLVVIFTLLGWIFIDQPGLKPGLFLPVGDVWPMLWQTITLQYTYGWADYLRLYALFIAATPLALWLLRKRLWWVVLAASFGVWALYPYSPWPAGWISAPLSWQLIFFIGFVIGFHWPNIQHWWKQRSVILRRVITSTLVPLGFLSLIATALLVFGHGIPGIGDQLATTHHDIEGYFEKDRLPLQRVILFGLWFISFFWLFNRYQKQIRRWLGWIFIPFGTNSLYVYTIQAFVIFFIMLITDKSEHWLVNLAVSIVTVGLVLLAVRTRFLMKIIPR